ncbi:MAG: hypothetical protein WCL39_15995, partial [Armatimonadota bacterium]
TGEILRSSPPPLSDFPKPIVWDAADLQEKRVFVRLVDADSGNGFAWMGLDQIDAGSALSVDFAKKPSLDGWTSDSPQPGIVEKGGVPFLAELNSIVPAGSSLTVPLGYSVKKIFLLGMTNSLDQGNPVWNDPRGRADRFFLGDKLGEVRINYWSGATAVYPLILGESLWWGRRFVQASEPFVSDAVAKASLADSLNLYPPTPQSDASYLAVIHPKNERIESLDFVDSTSKSGVPVICALTVEPQPGQTVQGMQVPHSRLTDDLKKFIAGKALRVSGKDEAAATNRLNRLRKSLYVDESKFQSDVVLDIPKSYKGPRVRFTGTPHASVLTNMFYYNVQDILDKIDDAGMYHTSTKDAPSWGGYEGFGTFTRVVGSYYTHTWTRDAARSTMEAVSLGYLDKGKLVMANLFRQARRWETDPGLKYKGVQLPAHICRIANLPGPTDGNFENDGHGIVMLMAHKLWQRLPDRDAWLKANWADVKRLGDWVGWQFDHPEISGATDVLLTDSESSGGIGNSIYPDSACLEGLKALA